jgi:hypothetical protein
MKNGGLHNGCVVEWGTVNIRNRGDLTVYPHAQSSDVISWCRVKDYSIRCLN